MVWQDDDQQADSAEGQMRLKILIISDTHRLVREVLLDLLPRFDYVLHAGDIGSVSTLDLIRSHCRTLIAVRGNIDQDLSELPEVVDISLGGHNFRILHDISQFHSEDAGHLDVLVFGHSHKPAVYEKGGITFINPGSIGPRRFKLPISYATMELKMDGGFHLQMHEIQPS